MSLFSFPGPFARGAYALIYKWSGSTFEEFYRLPTGERAYGVKALSVDGNHFLAVARWQAQTSLIFRWNQTHFDLFQEVPSRRVRYNVTHRISPSDFGALLINQPYKVKYYFQNTAFQLRRSFEHPMKKMPPFLVPVTYIKRHLSPREELS